MYSARIIADSVPNQNKHAPRLTTMLVTFPRIILPEILTHRQFSRNTSSSRAIPVEKLIEQVQENPFIPEYMGKNKPGMQATEEIAEDQKSTATEAWLGQRDAAVLCAKELKDLGLHKQSANRILEPFLWTTMIITATDWSNFFKQRYSDDAQPEMRHIAEMMGDAYYFTKPTLSYNHFPFCDLDDYAPENHRDKEKVSVARCARVSYTNQDKATTYEDDERLYTKLLTSGHLSPFEHCAYYSGQPNEYFANFRGWKAARKYIKDENIVEFVWPRTKP